MSGYKAEPRGKYAGTKMHLDGTESQRLVNWLEKYKLQPSAPLVITEAVEICKIQAKVIKNLLIEHPDMLEDRTQEQIEAALNKDLEKIQKQLQAGDNWQLVK